MSSALDIQGILATIEGKAAEFETAAAALRESAAGLRRAYQLEPAPPDPLAKVVRAHVYRSAPAATRTADPVTRTERTVTRQPPKTKRLTQTAERTAVIDAQVLAVCVKAGKPLARVTLVKDAGTTLYLLNHSIARLVKSKQLVTRGKGQPMRVGTPGIMAAAAASEGD